MLVAVIKHDSIGVYPRHVQFFGNFLDVHLAYSLVAGRYKYLSLSLSIFNCKTIQA